MAVDLRGRDFLKELDFTADELQHLLDLAARAEARPSAPATEQQRLRGRERRADLREDLDAHPVRVRGRPRTTRARTSPTWTRLARRSGTRSRPPTPRGCCAGCSTRSSSAGRRRPPWRSWPRTPTSRSTTGSPTSGTPPRCSPTSSRCPSTSAASRCQRGRVLLTWVTAGSTWAARCSSRARSWARTSGSARPRDLWPDKDVQDAAARARRRVRRAHHPHRGPGRGPARRRLRAHRRVGVDGRAQGGLGRSGSRELTPVPGEQRRRCARTGNPDAKFMHCLPAFHDTRHRRSAARSPSAPA